MVIDNQPALPYTSMDYFQKLIYHREVSNVQYVKVWIQSIKWFPLSYSLKLGWNLQVPYSIRRQSMAGENQITLVRNCFTLLSCVVSLVSAFCMIWKRFPCSSICRRWHQQLTLSQYVVRRPRQMWYVSLHSCRIWRTKQPQRGNFLEQTPSSVLELVCFFTEFTTSTCQCSSTYQ